MTNTKVVCIVSILFIVALVYGFKSFYFATEYRGENIVIGIIDDGVSNIALENVLEYNGPTINDKKTHGDSLLEYLHAKKFTGEIYFYSAENDSSIITEDNIINGLNWMKENGVEYVNISLSSRKKCANLQKWINHNKDIKVYCCYNNKLNSFDYPAMCKNVIASGSLSKVKYKKCDRKYRSQEIIVFSGKKIQKFKGNSFLSIETILNDMEDKT